MRQAGCILLWTRLGSNSCMHWDPIFAILLSLKEKWKEKSLERERESKWEIVIYMQKNV